MLTHYQPIIDMLQEKHSELLRSRQAKRDRDRKALTDAIAAWTRSPGGDYLDWSHKPGATVVTKTNKDRIGDLNARLNALPEVIIHKPLDTGSLADWLSKIDVEIEKYREILSVKRRQTELLGEYGEINDQKWIQEIFHFLERNPTVSAAIACLQRITNEAGLDFDWTNGLATHLNEHICPSAMISDIPSSDGPAYEHSCMHALQRAGWTTRLTPSTGDQGVDIIACKDGVSVAIQCKNYRTAVGNQAVQEVHAGKEFYEVDLAVVVSPSGYTASAKILAQKLNVLLLDHGLLSQLDTFKPYSSR